MTRCRSRLRLGGKLDRCMKDMGHDGRHAWWSADARVTVIWMHGAGGSSWRRIVPSKA